MQQEVRYRGWVHAGGEVRRRGSEVRRSGSEARISYLKRVQSFYDTGVTHSIKKLDLTSNVLYFRIAGKVYSQVHQFCASDNLTEVWHL